MTSCSAGTTFAPRDQNRPPAASAGVLLVDISGVVRHADARACVSLGYARHDLDGRPLTTVLATRDDGTTVVRRRDGTELAVEVCHSPVRDGADGLTASRFWPVAIAVPGLAVLAAATVRREDALVALVDVALAGHERADLAAAAVRAVADGLDAGAAALLELSADGGLTLLAETGGRGGRAPREPTTRLAFALEDAAPVLDDPAPSLGAATLAGGDGIVAVVRAGGESFGLLFVHGAGHRVFDAADRTFLGTAADLLGAALDARHVVPGGRVASLAATCS